MGSASFAEIQDSSGRIQVYLRRDDLCPGEDKTLYNTVFKKLLDIGDIIGIRGFAFRTQVGEISVHVKEMVILSKSVRPLPIVKEAEIEDFPLREYCATCGVCARECPGRAIPTDGGDPSAGSKRWQIDEVACYRSWRELGTSCGVCQVVCPFSRGTA